ncbi:DgyrCDS14703 [Dimorphilus gyrociliatus]|uniref:DgyrCDS14703 n=1 Tax=Dimorphilus gyrociliatus TaxID=2664684 RepID=A0A7I8WEW3_9ANNE|nr:DgyrCDS14703 [Dimorphilus gyrociliatus]
MKGSTIAIFTLLFLSFVNVVHLQGFRLEVEIPAHILEDVEDRIIIFRQNSGAPVCSFSLTKPDGTLVTQGTKTVNSAYVPHTLSGSLFSGITEDYILTYTFNCQGAGETVEFEMRSCVNSIESFGSSSLPATFNIGIDVSAFQAPPITVLIRGSSGSATCTVAEPDPSIASINNRGPETLIQGAMEIAVTKDCSVDSLFLVSTCTKNGKNFENEIPIYFTPSTISPWAIL